jgi:hypothetical protein
MFFRSIISLVCVMESTVLLVAPPPAAADVLFVDDNICPNPGEGTEELPYCSIQTAIDNSADGDEVVVAEGTYFEAISFLGRAITVRSTDPGDPAVVANTVIDGTGHFHVVQCVSGEGADTVLNGFVITGGNADGATPNNRGGGMYNFASSPTVMNCVFTDNSAALFGGGMHNQAGSPTVTSCSFSGNTAGIGGGMANTEGGSPAVSDCSFSGNTADNLGAGMANVGGDSSPTVTNCSFSGNAGGIGGGMGTSGGSPMVTSCTFLDNTADFGAGMLNGGGSGATVVNSAFSGNTATSDGGGMHNAGSTVTVINCTLTGNSAAVGGGLSNEESSPTVANSILWGNSPDEVSGSTPTVTYSDVQGGAPGIGNIDVDPLFVDPGNDDYRLSAGSPCIDAASNLAVPIGVTTDLDGNPRFVDDPCKADTGLGDPPIVDMGAYEFQCCSCDLDDDCAVGVTDFLALLAVWGPCADCDNCPADFDGNCEVGVTDFLILLGNWGSCP